ncbi:MAG TPA: ribosomal protein S18-alanine N-acetyltransferase [Lachnospiraceae bacterium]|jgi:[ribosomal protein S18]-alanine N-acetyltransferase|nr:ribosomal protein S18-alanine N-acetyltransferase [Lachnospiraceae bacterium]
MMEDCELIIREMREEDVDAICQIEQESFSMPWRKQDFLDMITYDHLLYLVAEFGNIIVGGCGLRMIVGEGEITNVAIREAYRNRGYGAKLLAAMLEKGNELGMTAFTLEVRKSNLSAIHVYEKMGFISEGIRKNFYEKPCEDAVIMWKR